MQIIVEMQNIPYFLPVVYIYIYTGGNNSQLHINMYDMQNMQKQLKDVCLLHTSVAHSEVMFDHMFICYVWLMDMKMIRIVT